MKAPRFTLLLVPIIGMVVTGLYWKFFADQLPADQEPNLWLVFGPAAGVWLLAFVGTLWAGWLRKPNASPDMKWQGRAALGVFVGQSLVTTHFYLQPAMESMGKGSGPELGGTYLWVGVAFLVIGVGVFAWNIRKAVMT